MTDYTAYFWANHGGMTFGVKLIRETPWGEDTPLFQEIDCLLHKECVVIAHAVTKQRYAFLNAADLELLRDDE